ncbi:C13 family peptidase [Microvirga thermotolerans]|uniref:Peptidase C13, legumain asparaginyl peptidase n=1 Tax=Microvirga thermotolerans TaxID=2651334 RepID=A0A5P9JYM4_9HYPH|nr:C13 family peptidase [Microvirga thermotolerans]QFU17241.1 peptidase C13, legumain asparaginyl peptidase [Microvirga thermotolerans]
MRRILALVLLGLALGLGLPGGAWSQPAPRSGAFRVEPHRPGQMDVYILSFGLWGPQSVFESEAKGAARILERQLGTAGRTIVLSNTKRRSDATPQALFAAAEAVGRALDPEEDVLVLVLTSHGGPQGIGLVSRRVEGVMTPGLVRGLLERAKARNRVVIVSACYSGIFAKALADERTLVITAAAEDRSSFGCRDGAAWTYFGDAFFNRALRSDPRLDAAFDRARRLVSDRERREGFEPSRPQIAGGEHVLARLTARCALAQPRRVC